MQLYQNAVLPRLSIYDNERPLRKRITRETCNIAKTTNETKTIVIDSVLCIKLEDRIKYTDSH